WEIARFLEQYGSERLLFGSDFPFGSPAQELQKVTRLALGAEDMENLVSRNFLRLIGAIPKQDHSAC
ncbi:MAG: hypothetical protein C0394_06985, partial [Syntrophus sp. (in: bacteria)]|nr:hypothetical protein [Syntrophus sp. (in: bacteria)]